MNIPDKCCLDVSVWVWYFLFSVQFNSIQGLSFAAALLCWIAKQGKKCGAKIWFNNQPFNPLTLPSRNLAYHLSTFCSVRTELMLTPSSFWLVMVCNIGLPWSSTFNISTLNKYSTLIWYLTLMLLISSLAASSWNAEKYLIEARMFNRGLFTGNESLFGITGCCQHRRG